MGKRGPKPLPSAEKAKRGTLRPSRERNREQATVAPAVAAPVVPVRDYGAITERYVADVIAGRIIAGRWTRLACERQQRDRRRAATDPSWPYVWSASHAADVCAFIERCPHVEGRWETPTIVLQAWQVFIVAMLFGWRHRADLTRRRFVSLYLELGRKGAKSTLMAALGLYHLLHEDEPGASVICGASTGLQARVVFGIAQKMVRRSAWLRAAGIEVFAHALVTGDGSMRPVNARATTLDGLNPSCIILDESHAQSFELHDVLKSAQGGRRNPLMLCPTTAGYDLLSVGYALRGQLQKVLDRVYENDALSGVIYALDEIDDWRDPAAWPKANPGLGITPSLDWVQRYCLDAQQTPGLEGEFRVKVCSEWLASATTWLSVAAWDRCADAKLTIEQFRGRPCWIGGDLAALDDLAAVALVFEHGDHLAVFSRFYLPADVVDERARAVPAYRAWVDAGVLRVTDGSMIDFGQIERDLRGDAKAYKVKDVAFDQYASIQIAGALANDGIPARVEPKTAKNFTPAARELETRIKHGRIKHDGNPILRWNVSNVCVTRRTDDTLLPKKSHAESPDKIDGVDALCQAIGGYLRQAPAKRAPRLIVL